MKKTVKRSEIKNAIRDILNESFLAKEGREVTSFTPYTPEEKARNFEYLMTGCGRSLEERNPSYARALKAAEERRKQKQLEKSGKEIEETMNYGANRASSDNNYREMWKQKYLNGLLEKCDSILNSNEKVPVDEIIETYKKLMSIGDSDIMKYDVRLSQLREEIKTRVESLLVFIRKLLTNKQY